MPTKVRYLVTLLFSWPYLLIQVVRWHAANRNKILSLYSAGISSLQCQRSLTQHGFFEHGERDCKVAGLPRQSRWSKTKNGIWFPGCVACLRIYGNLWRELSQAREMITGKAWGWKRPEHDASGQHKSETFQSRTHQNYGHHAGFKDKLGLCMVHSTGAVKRVPSSLIDPLHPHTSPIGIPDDAERKPNSHKLLERQKPTFRENPSTNPANKPQVQVEYARIDCLAPPHLSHLFLSNIAVHPCHYGDKSKRVPFGG